MNKDSFLMSHCRLCLSEKYISINIFENSHIASKIIECTNLQISANDSYPKNICSPCLLQLNDAYKFKKKCEKSAEILKSRIFSNFKPSSVTISVSANEQINQDEIFFDNTPTQEIVSLAEIPNNASQSNEQTSLLTLSDKEQRNIELCTDSKTDSVSSEFSESENNISDFENSTNSLFITTKKIDISNTSENKKLNRCIKCGKLCKSPRFLAKHMKVHFKADKTQKVNKRDYKCNLCDEVFTQIDNLKIHKRTHSLEKLYQCVICSKSFTQLSNLYVHEHVHSNVRNFKCQVCSMSFKLSSHLSVHMKTHSDIKDYECSLCGKGFRKNSNLSIHMRTHSGEKPFSCEYCGKSFSDSSNLATHIRTHTGTKRFTCNICDKSFVQKVSMIRHQKRKHDKSN